MTHNSIALVEEYIGAAYRGEIGAAGAMLADDVTLQMGGSNPLSGTYKGRDAFFGAFGKMMELSRGTYRMSEQQGWLSGEGRVALLAREQVELQGEIVSFDRVIVYEIADGKIQAVRVYEGDPEIADGAFGGS
jgi:ketosteroid isomerase-like protein